MPRLDPRHPFLFFRQPEFRHQQIVRKRGFGHAFKRRVKSFRRGLDPFIARPRKKMRPQERTDRPVIVKNSGFMLNRVEPFEERNVKPVTRKKIMVKFVDDSVKLGIHALNVTQSAAISRARDAILFDFAAAPACVGAVGA